MQRCDFSAVLYLFLRLSLLASLLLAGCASSPKVSVEDQVGNRALQWVDALIALDYDAALTFMTPSYQSGPRAERFRGDFAGAGYWQDAEIKWVKCDEESGAEESAAEENAIVDASADVMTAPDNKNVSDNADACVVTVWDDCGKSFSGPISTAATVSTRSDRCEVRLMLTVMKPPEMSYPMPIPYEMTWLNINGSWYIYRK